MTRREDVMTMDRAAAQRHNRRRLFAFIVLAVVMALVAFLGMVLPIREGGFRVYP